jgi:hypothetical protein
VFDHGVDGEIRSEGQKAARVVQKLIDHGELMPYLFLTHLLFAQ